MPLFIYQCPSCDHRFEALIREKNDTPKTCPSCGAEKPDRQLPRFATIESRAPEPKSPCAEGHCGTNSCPYANG